MKEMGLKVSRAEFEGNLEAKGFDLGFRDDIIPLLSETRNFKTEFDEDLKLVKEALICLLPGEPWKNNPDKQKIKNIENT